MTPALMLIASFADPDPGSCAFLAPGSGIRNRFLPDPGSKPIFLVSLMTFFVVKSSTIPLKIGPNFFLQHFKTKIIFNFVKFVAMYIKRYDHKFFSSLSFVAVFGSWIRDPGFGIRDG